MAPNVGILGMETYFPKRYVAQEDLETFNGIPAGKYTIGLGQQAMAFTDASEDINSICMTAVMNLLEKYGIHPSEVGRLEVGTETLIDKSKSVKTTIARLFNDQGAYDFEGVDSINACYGGTAALLNSVGWVESSAWDGRYAIVVCGDIAVYEEGPARPTGGCAAVAMLVGRDAPISFNPSIRASHMEDAYDFYKPHTDSEYPTVFGHESNECYLRALDSCYQRFSDKWAAKGHGDFSLNDAAHVVLHSPYNKLVKKSGARLLYNDWLRNPDAPEFAPYAADLAEWKDVAPETTYNDRALEKQFIAMAKPMYSTKVEPSVHVPAQLGNSYTASMYTGLQSLVNSWAEHPDPNSSIGKTCLMFSYGSGLAATLYPLEVVGDTRYIADIGKVKERLEARTRASPEEFTAALAMREDRYGKFDWSPEIVEENMFPGTYYLKNVDEHGRRTYDHTPKLETLTEDDLNHSFSSLLASSATTFDRQMSGVPQRRMFHTCSDSSDLDSNPLAQRPLGINPLGANPLAQRQQGADFPSVGSYPAAQLWKNAGKRSFSSSAARAAAPTPGLRLAAAATRALRFLR
jgi:hydroxymethylglutaryl-CoA synthase